MAESDEGQRIKFEEGIREIMKAENKISQLPPPKLKPNTTPTPQSVEFHNGGFECNSL